MGGCFFVCLVVNKSVLFVGRPNGRLSVHVVPIISASRRLAFTVIVPLCICNIRILTTNTYFSPIRRSTFVIYCLQRRAIIERTITYTLDIVSYRYAC